MWLLSEQFAHLSAFALTEYTVELVINDRHLVIILSERYPLHHPVTLCIKSHDIVYVQPIEVWFGILTFLFFGQVNHKHAVYLGFEMLPALCLPYLRLMQPVLSVPLPVVPVIRGEELVVI